jgi:hypothetical protein
VGGVLILFLLLVVAGFFYVSRQKQILDKQRQELEIDQWIVSSPKDAEIVVNMNNPLNDKKEDINNMEDGNTIVKESLSVKIHSNEHVMI